MIHISNVLNMPLKKWEKAICNLSCGTNANMFVILEGNMGKASSCTSAKCTNKPNHRGKDAPLTFNVFSPTNTVMAPPKQNKHRFAAQQKKTLHGSSDSIHNNYFTQPRP